MSKYYTAEDGSIHRKGKDSDNDDVFTAEESFEFTEDRIGHRTNDPAQDIHYASWNTRTAFWIITIVFSIVISCVLYYQTKGWLFTKVTDPKHISDYARNICHYVAPFVIGGASLIATIYCGIKYGENYRYGYEAYLTSIIAGSTVGMAATFICFVLRYFLTVGFYCFCLWAAVKIFLWLSDKCEEWH